jgi:hypothetical protein
MVERRPCWPCCRTLVLILGVLIVALPGLHHLRRLDPHRQAIVQRRCR